MRNWWALFLGLAVVAGGVVQTTLARDLPTIRPPDGVTTPGNRVRFLFNHHVWRDADGAPLPFASEDAILEFLSTAPVVETKKIGIGINGIYKVLLEKDGIRLWAGYRNVNVQRPPVHNPGRSVRKHFRDAAIFEAAAYRLSRMLGLNAVPPTVVRRLFDTKGTLQLWIQNAVMEKDRLERGLAPPTATQRVFQLNNMKVFDALIENEDRNQGNMLWDRDWRLWMIDHTRAFRTNPVPPLLALVRACDRYVFKRLKALDPAAVEEQMDGLLSGRQIKTLLRRQARLVQHFEKLIAENGERSILF